MFDEFDKRMAAFSEATHKDAMISQFVPATGMQSKLEEGGIQALDVGCGRGMHIAELGITFSYASISPESKTPCTNHMLNLFSVQRTARCHIISNIRSRC